MSTMPVVVENAAKVFRHPMYVWKTVEAVKNVSFAIEQGEVIGFVGHNGAGKTTTVKMIMGFISQTAGNISVFGESPKNVKVKQKIGFLPERPYFYTQLTAGEFLSYFAGLSGIKRKFIPDLIEKNLKRVGLEGQKKMKLAAFSKGMLQRIGIAQAIIHDPSLIIMDEPMSGLDPAGRKEVKNLIREFKKEGKTVLFSSHILSDIENLSDKVLIIEKGLVKNFGRLDEIISSKDITYRIVFSALQKECDSVFSFHKDAKFENGFFNLTLSTEDEMNKALKSLTNGCYTIKEAGAVFPTLEEYIFKTGGSNE